MVALSGPDRVAGPIRPSRPRSLLALPWVRIRCFHCCGLGSVPGQETEIPQATRHGFPSEKTKKLRTGRCGALAGKCLRAHPAVSPSLGMMLPRRPLVSTAVPVGEPEPKVGPPTLIPSAAGSWLDGPGSDHEPWFP